MSVNKELLRVSGAMRTRHGKAALSRGELNLQGAKERIERIARSAKREVRETKARLLYQKHLPILKKIFFPHRPPRMSVEERQTLVSCAEFLKLKKGSCKKLAPMFPGRTREFREKKLADHLATFFIQEMKRSEVFK